MAMLFFVLLDLTYSSVLMLIILPHSKTSLASGLIHLSLCYKMLKSCNDGLCNIPGSEWDVSVWPRYRRYYGTEDRRGEESYYKGLCYSTFSLILEYWRRGGGVYSLLLNAIILNSLVLISYHHSSQILTHMRNRRIFPDLHHWWQYTLLKTLVLKRMLTTIGQSKAFIYILQISFFLIILLCVCYS